jgi:tripartite-type tricarboxylate transporter receptor subunit TctC
MRASLGQTVIIENVGGADGTIATGRAVRARPDGYTIEFGILGTHVLNGAFYALPYDVLNDFTFGGSPAKCPMLPIYATIDAAVKNGRTIHQTR